jgi:hypothetical protein
MWGEQKLGTDVDRLPTEKVVEGLSGVQRWDEHLQI